MESRAFKGSTSEAKCESFLPSEAKGKNLCLEIWLEELDLTWDPPSRRDQLLSGSGGWGMLGGHAYSPEPSYYTATWVSLFVFVGVFLACILCEVKV